MKKLGKTFLIGTAFAASVAALVGCTPESSVYGPPEDVDPTTELIECVYGPPEYFTQTSEEDSDPEIDVTEEINEDVYGPPVEDFTE